MDLVRQAIADARRVLVVGHVNPDPDCIGGLLVLTAGLSQLGKASGLILPTETVNRKNRFLLQLLDPPGPIDGPDLIVVLETASKKRINLPKDFRLPEAPICNIDHHLANERFGRFNWVDTGAASTSQMVLHLLRGLEIQIDAVSATLLYAGLHSDTLGLSLDGTDAAALTAGAELARCGARIGWVCKKLHRSLSTVEFELIQLVYAHTRRSDCGRFAWSWASFEDLAGIGAKPCDVEEQVAVPRSIEGIKLAAFFSETKPGTVRINLRAEDRLNILPLARQLGGGGHAQAAGAVVEGALAEVMDRVQTLAVAFLDGPEARQPIALENAHGQ